MLIDSRFPKFLIVGGLNTALNYLVWAFFIFLGLGYFLATTFAFIIGLFINFKSQAKFVFNSKSNRPFFLYVVCWLIIYLAHLGFLRLLMSIGVNTYLAGAISTPPMAVLSFLLLRHVAFRESDPTKL